jgi:hypothetical protein
MKTVVDVARDLRSIEDLYEAVIVQAVHKANDRLMPGGEAMVALGHAASPREWAENIEAAEFRHLTSCDRLDHTRCRYAEHIADEDEHEPILQTLLFWSEAWRDYDLERRPTVRTEVNFIRGRLEWAWENVIEWDDFAEDINSARKRLENLLYAGSRPAFKGNPCMYDGRTLVRVTKPARGPKGEKIWVLTDWFCPKCRRSYSEVEYARNQVGALESLHYRHFGEEAYCTIDKAAKRIGRPPATVWSWINRVQVRAVCTLDDQRTFVHIADVHDRDRLARERAERSKSGRMSA